jgi:hypothetical protein
VGNSLSIVPTNFQRRRCGDPGGLLRQNVDTGQVVRIAGAIPGQATGYCAGEGYLDECVPVGRYRYGLATPYRCCEACCTTQFYVEYAVMLAPEANCEATRRPDNPRPVAYTGQVPWRDRQEICSFVPPPDAGRPDTLGSRPLDDAGRPTGTPGTAEPQPGPGGGTAPPTAPGTGTGRSQNRGGCSVGGTGGPTAALVLGGLLLAAGFVRVSARRRKPRT